MLFAAKSLNHVMEELITEFNKQNQDVTVVGNYDSSGTLMVQIQEGAACDIFFSAATKQMDELEKQGGIVIEGTRHDLLNNQLCVVTCKGINTKVTGLTDMNLASSLAIAGGTVPVGKYTRQALGNVAINECANVGAVTAAVSEGANEVGTVYYSDIYGLEDKLEVLEKVSYELSGDVIYPVAAIHNQEADEQEKAAAEEFLNFLLSDTATEIFEKYQFDVMQE